jgi:hypothetical protein
MAARRRRWTAEDRRRDSERRWLSDHKISLADYQAMVVAQGGRCGICEREAKLVIDHDHETGEIRGLLCTPCNTALGRFGDSEDGVRRALAYLESPPARRVLNVRRVLEVLRGG